MESKPATDLLRDRSSSSVTSTDDEALMLAWLFPWDDWSRGALDELAKMIKGSPGEFEHSQKFLHLDTRSEGDGSARSLDSDDVLLNPEFSSQSIPFCGKFTFNLKKLPHILQEGWWLGSGRGRPSGQEIDIQLAPPTKEWGIASKHARIYIDEQSPQFILEARHSVVLGRNGETKPLYAESHTLENGDLLTIGNCEYMFRYNAARLEVYHQQILILIRDERAPVRGRPVPSSVGVPTWIGRWLRTPTSLGEGTFGRVFVGWSPKKTAVAIKVFGQPVKQEIRRHQAIMRRIGYHENILQLLHCESDFSAEPSYATCVYTPMVQADLSNMIRSYQFDLDARVALLSDYLNGLSYLHDQNIMHRDIKLENLGVTAFSNPKGIILDLDSATAENTSNEHWRGTRIYQPPEVIELRDWDKHRIGAAPEPYNKSVDIWALGLSMFALNLHENWSWAAFRPAGMRVPDNSSVTRDLHAEFHKTLAEGKAGIEELGQILLFEWIESMTRYASRERASASELVAVVQAKVKFSGRGEIKLVETQLVENKGQKRPPEEDPKDFGERDGKKRRPWEGPLPQNA